MYDFDAYRKYREQQQNADDAYASHLSAVSEELVENRLNAIRESYTTTTYSTKELLRSNLANFEETVYKSFVAESMALIAACAVKAVNDSDAFDYNRESAILQNLAKSWVEEQSMYELQSKMNSNATLSSIDCSCKKHTAIVMEKANKKIDDNREDEKFIFEIEDDDKDSFYKELDAVNADELVYQIRDRVADASQEFLDNYVQDKMAIKAIIKDTKASIDDMRTAYAADNSDVPDTSDPDDSTDNSTEYDPYEAHNKEPEDTYTSNAPTVDDIEESYMHVAKRQINDIMHKPCTSIYEAMVVNLSAASYKNEVLREEFVLENTKLDTDAIRNRVGVMYTWLETLNTSGAEIMDESYLLSTLNEIKNM